jgi:hypothetical protein
LIREWQLLGIQLHDTSAQSLEREPLRRGLDSRIAEVDGGNPCTGSNHGLGVETHTAADFQYRCTWQSVEGKYLVKRLAIGREQPSPSYESGIDFVKPAS